MATTTEPAAAHGKRADARRNVAAILDAALHCLARDPEANVGEIAKQAGVGRVTLYGHFASRAELVDAVVTRAMADTDAALNEVDLSGDPREALTRLVGGTWQIVDQIRALMQAAERTLPAERVHAAHEGPARRVEALIERGRDAGVFRVDLPTPWLITVFHGVLHAAAAEVGAGNVAADDAPELITATLLAAYAPKEQTA
jgi:TetR/AcrR family transcriptional repressor of mexCD-oprJ operon